MPGAYNASACQAYFFNRSETTEAAARTEESALNSSCFYPVKQVAGGGGECVLAYTRFSYSVPGCSSSFVSRHSFVPHPITHRSFEPITIVLALVALANRERSAAGARKRMTSNARNVLEKRQRRGEIFPKTTRETRLVNVKERMFWLGI